MFACNRYTVSGVASMSLYGPDPTVALNSPDFGGSIDSQRCFGMIGAAARARTGKDGFGAVSLMVVFRLYSYENFTSAFVSGCPSCHFGPERSVMS